MANRLTRLERLEEAIGVRLSTCTCPRVGPNAVRWLVVRVAEDRPGEAEASLADAQNVFDSCPARHAVDDMPHVITVTSVDSTL